MGRRESPEKAAVRWEKLELLQQHYPEFVPFCEDVMVLLGFRLSEIQGDIAEFMQYGPQHLMVQAQRSQAKTTIAAAFAVWCLIHSPHYRVLVVSAGGTQANEISTLIVRIILNMEELECMRPDRMAGDRESVEAFDIHHSLKGLDKSPSVACVGITANLQGKRADLLIADDVESTKNAMTATQRAVLAHLVKDFPSICKTGRILWLGTPQTQDSIYVALPSKGVTVRVWPGRYPTAEQMKNYTGLLAPLLVRRIEADPSLQEGGGVDGTQGKPIDPSYLGEQNLQWTELQQGTPYFQLQHMLSTKLTDAMRHPLKTEQLVVLSGLGEYLPMSVVRGMTNITLMDFSSADFAFQMQGPHDISRDVAKATASVFYIDPAAGGLNADETAYSFIQHLNGNLYLRIVGGIHGGYDRPKLEHLAKLIAEHKPSVVKIEKNMGYGAFREVFIPVLREFYKDCAIEDDLVTGQKELRIINTLAPVIGRGALIVDKAAVAHDNQTCDRYGAAERKSYSFFHQLAKVSKDKGALVHDDRLDAVEGGVRHFQEALALDQKKAVEAQAKREWEEAMKDPLGHNRYNYVGPRSRTAGSLNRRWLTARR